MSATPDHSYSAAGPAVCSAPPTGGSPSRWRGRRTATWSRPGWKRAAPIDEPWEAIASGAERSQSEELVDPAILLGLPVAALPTDVVAPLADARFAPRMTPGVRGR